MKFLSFQKPISMQKRLLILGQPVNGLQKIRHFENQLTVFKVPGEINTDDLSPATDAWSRPDILFMH